MNLLSGIFIMVVAILVVSSICLGFIICYFITQRNRDTGRQAETSTPSVDNPRNNETQLDRIERNVKQAISSSKCFLLISLSVSLVAIGLAGCAIGMIRPDISWWQCKLPLCVGLVGIGGAVIGILLGVSSRRNRKPK